MVKEGGGGGEGMRVLGKYELGRTLGEGNFGKVKYALHVHSGHPYAIKVLDRRRVQSLKITDQVCIMQHTHMSYCTCIYVYAYAQSDVYLHGRLRGRSPP